MITLRVIISEMLGTSPGGIGRYTEELTRALIETAPRNCTVEAFVAASTEPEYRIVAERLPGLAALHKSSLAARELKAAWQHGFTRLPGSGMIHAPSLLAPLARHDRLNSSEQVVVTVHDAAAWTDPEALGSRAVAWNRAMVKRAERYADAIVVPSHTVADQLAEIANVGDRIRVISGAGSTSLTPPPDADERAIAMDLPERYVLTMGGLEVRTGVGAVIQSLSHIDSDVPLIVVGPEADSEALRESVYGAGVDPQRVRGVGYLDDADLSVVLSRASVLAYANLADGLGMTMLDAFALGVPVVHSDAPALVELAADAGIGVERSDPDGYPERLAGAISEVLNDRQLAIRLGYSGSDRANAFDWRNSAEKVWQLHADL